MVKILDGRELSNKILTELKQEAKELNKPLKLGIIMVGDDDVSKKYIEQKKKKGDELGVEVKVYRYDKDITTKKLREQIGVICRVKDIGGVIVQLPLPGHINEQGVLDAILPEKDVDVLSSKALGKFYTGKSKILPPTVAGIAKLLDEYKIEAKGKIVAIVGQGKLVGKPASIEFERMGATVLSINEFTQNKEELIKKADIIVSGVGKSGVITKEMVKEGAVVIDAGTSMESGKLKGDTAEDVSDIASHITPVPGGVGPMTVVMLFYNLIKLARQ